MASLGVNIDHIANIREARRTVEPDPCRMAMLAELGGADGITVHLAKTVDTSKTGMLNSCGRPFGLDLNLEMAATAEMVAIALRVKPDMVTLVPEHRQEVTTEGGLDVVAQLSELTAMVSQLQPAVFR